jgi:hypothetical protein
VEEPSMKVKLHRCKNSWLKVPTHACWRVQKALDEAGIDYEVVHGPVEPHDRAALEALSGQRRYPVIEFSDGGILAEDSKDMVARIEAGTLFDGHHAHGITHDVHDRAHEGHPIDTESM